jgi:hypothetical protein
MNYQIVFYLKYVYFQFYFKCKENQSDKALTKAIVENTISYIYRIENYTGGCKIIGDDPICQ